MSGSATAPSERLERIAARARAALLARPDFQRRVRFDFGVDGALFIDGAEGRVTTAPSREAQESPQNRTAPEPELEIAVSLDDFRDMARGRLDPGLAVLKRRMRVSGDLALAGEIALLLRAAPDAD